MFLGPLLFGMFSYTFGMKLSQYVLENYPDLMKKYGLHYGMMKGEKLNGFDVYHNKDTFLNENDEQLNKLLSLNIHSTRLLIYSFLLLITISIFGFQIRY